VLLYVVVRARREQKRFLMGCDIPGGRNRAAFTHCTDESVIPSNARPSSSFPLSAALKTQTEDAGETGQDTQSYHRVAGFHTAGAADVAQGSLAAAGSNTSYADIQINCWAKC